MIRTAALIGAGAVGSFFITGMKEKLGDDLFMIAEGPRYERLKKDGIIVNGESISLNVKRPEEAKGADIIIVCVKYGSLEDALDNMEIIADDHTIILCPMNGVDSEDIIAARLGRRHIIHSMMVIAAERSGNEIIYNNGVAPCVHYGRVPGYCSDEDIEALAGLFEMTGLHNKFHDNIITVMWNKFALNISTNIAQAIIGCNYGAYKTSRYMNELGQRLCDELLEVARAKGIECTFDNQRALRTIGTDNRARFSTLQDLAAKRHTEVDMFCGAIIRMGREAGVATPFNEFAYLAIKALEEKNDGLIT